MWIKIISIIVAVAGVNAVKYLAYQDGYKDGAKSAVDIDNRIFMGINKENTSLHEENRRLRERVDTLEWLLKLTLKYAEDGELGGYELCDLCDHFGTCENHPAASCTRTFDTSSDFIHERMRELGLEVPDGD